MNKYLPIESEYNRLRLDLTEGHLWLEEWVSGDELVDVDKNIIGKFSLTGFHQFVAENELTQSHHKEKEIQNNLNLIDRLIHDFRVLTIKRLNNVVESGIGSDIDQFYDQKFNELLLETDRGIILVQYQLMSELENRKTEFGYIVTLFLLINAVVFFILIATKRARDRFENSFLAEKEKAEVTLHSIGDAVITTDIHGDVDYLNIVAENLTGSTCDEAKGMALSDVFNIENSKTGEKVESPADKLFREGTIVGLANSTRLLSKDGNSYIISDSASPIHNNDGDMVGVVLVFQDDTERHEMVSKLEESEQKYRRLVENIQHHYFFYSHDVNGEFTFVSSSVTDILGYQKTEFLDNYEKYLTDEALNKNVHVHTEKSIEGVQQPPYEVGIYHSDGSIKYLEVSETPLKNDDGVVVAVEGVAKDITQRVVMQRSLQKQKDLLEYSSNHDALTGLSNRTLFTDRLKQALHRIEHNSQEVAVLFIDIDRFKEVNDSFGHHFGDHLLIQVAERLKGCLRGSDTVSRFGGDEFALILENFESDKQVIDTVKKVMDSVIAPFLIENHTFYITLSVGVSVAPVDGVLPEQLIKNADAAMYKAKDSGRNTYCFYTQEMTENAVSRIQLATSLKEAVLDNQLVLHYQPQINTQTDKLIGIEALVRWKHPEKGYIPPDDFIPLAEETGLIFDLDEWVMFEAMKQTVTWYEKGLMPGTTSINVSVKHLSGPNFLKLIARLLETTGCKPEWLEFEVTETQIMRHPEESIQILQSIKDLGIRISVDDFGTGYSSLSYLKRLPIETHFQVISAISKLCCK